MTLTLDLNYLDAIAFHNRMVNEKKVNDLNLTLMSELYPEESIVLIEQGFFNTHLN